MNLHIPKPCSENWEAMNPSEKGRMCDVCNKQVFDFTNSTLKDIEEQFLVNNKNLCGRISSKLLTEQYVQQQYKKEYKSKLKLFLIATIICFGANLFTLEKASASIFLKIKNKILTVSDTNQIIVKGKVRDLDSKELLPFVNVIMMENDSVIANTMTDIDGNFTIKLNMPTANNLSLKIVYVGFKTLLIKNFKPTKQQIDISLEMEGVLQGDFIIEIPEPNPISNPFQSGKTISGDEYRKMPK